mmetsp:Transcript_2063/g.4004  ORF Transcript_2063/g.4004 Transcript_2063/m.4004 type:complete len:206 (+) Transcript_2063:799-1416(+)
MVFLRRTSIVRQTLLTSTVAQRPPWRTTTWFFINSICLHPKVSAKSPPLMYMLSTQFSSPWAAILTAFQLRQLKRSKSSLRLLWYIIWLFCAIEQPCRMGVHMNSSVLCGCTICRPGPFAFAPILFLPLPSSSLRWPTWPRFTVIFLTTQKPRDAFNVLSTCFFKSETKLWARSPSTTPCLLIYHCAAMFLRIPPLPRAGPFSTF